MGEFAWERLRRTPDVEAPNLFAYDATDRLLTERALALAAEEGIAGEEIAVIGDEYGAITLRLADAGLSGIRVHQDLVTGRRALARNAVALGLVENTDAADAGRHVAPGHAEQPPAGPRFLSCELDASLLQHARLVLLQLPKALAELEEIADAVARWAAPDVTLVAGGRVKHMTLAQNEVLGRFFGRVQPQRAAQKSRLLVAAEPLPVADELPFPAFAAVDAPGIGPLTLAAHGAVFAGARLDIGTRVLLEGLSAHPGPQLRRTPAESRDKGVDRAEVADSSEVERASSRPAGEPLRSASTLDDREAEAVPTVVDLGCGTGALAAWFALRHPTVRVVATDRSAAAVRSARATMRANGLEDRVQVTHDDAGSALPAASADLILLNPPFHLGTSVHTRAATRLFEASARLLRPGGELFAVWNSHLGHRPHLERLIGPTEQLLRTPKFTVTRSVRR